MLEFCDDGPIASVTRTTLMSKGLEIRCYDYVNHPYEKVRDALKQNAINVFQAATKAATSRAQSVAAELHVDLGGIGVKADIKISVKNIEEKVADAKSGAATRLQLEWEAATAPRSEEHTSELQSRRDLVCRLLLEKKKPLGTTNIKGRNVMVNLVGTPA